MKTESMTPSTSDPRPSPRPITLNALVRLLAAATLPWGSFPWNEAHGITINMEYANEGDSVPHDENPSWDPDGTILKSHFQMAKSIWEHLLPGGSDYDIVFEWDNDIDGLGLTSPSLPNPGGYVIEMNSDSSWYADSDLEVNSEFTFTQTLYSSLSAADRSARFAGTPPPTTFEVGYVGLGDSTTSLQPGVTSASGFDMLSVALHEIGHALGINGVEPGDYNIDPQHLGGMGGVLIKEANDDDPFESHFAGSGAAPWLMDGATRRGERTLPSSADVLAIAEDQGITVVQLARVGSIISTSWSNSLNWIGGDVPDATQDVYIAHGGGITLNVDAQVRNLAVLSGPNSVAVQDRALYVLGSEANGALTNGTLNYDGAAISVGPGGRIAANYLIGDPNALTTTTGSLVRFNAFTPGSSTVTSATFNGSVAIGFDNDLAGQVAPLEIAFLPSWADWSIGENLIIGDENFADLIVDDGTWTINGDVAIGKVTTLLGGGWGGTVTFQNNAIMEVGGNFTIEGPGAAIIVDGATNLNIAGNVTIGKGGLLAYRDDRMADSRPHFIAGGQSLLIEGSLVAGSSGALIFEDSSSAADATVIVEGGAGQDAYSGAVIFRGDSSAGDVSTVPRASFRTKGGRRGPTSAGFEIAGNGGVVRFDGTSGAGDSTFINEGGAEYVGGTGGQTVFTQTSSAQNSIIDNHGAAHFNAGGGATHFFDNSTGDRATITNHATGTSSFAVSSARTVFYDFSSAGNATIENLAASGQTVPFGLTEFRGNSSAANATIHNRGHIPVGGLAGRTVFYDEATADISTIHIYEGYSDAGRVEFRGNSSAANSHIFVNDVPGIIGSSGNGGHVIFRDISTAASSHITLRQDACCNGIQFHDNATAANSLIVAEEGAGGANFFGSSTAANAVMSLGRGSVSTFWDRATAANSVFSLSGGAQLQFQMNSSAGDAQIGAAGSSVYPIAGGSILFNTTSLANNATITLHGGTAPLAPGATVAFINGAHAGNSTITASGPSNGGTGAQISFNSGARGDTVRLIANAGASIDFMSQRFYGDGSTSVGSIEGAGTVFLRGSHVITGARNSDDTVSGPITDAGVVGGRLTKVGTGTLTLAGANTYTGVTTVTEGKLVVTGSIAGGAVVNNGGTLLGSGNVAGGLTVNAGGVISPGLSPGTLTVGGFTMNSGATLNFELGPSVRDHIVLTGNGDVVLDGLLNISFLDGFTPTLGQTFPLLEGTVGSITGAFDAVVSPVIKGLTFNVVQNSSSIMLQAGPPVSPTADFNSDGTVDGDDLTQWKADFGLNGDSDADNDNDSDGGDFLTWQRQLGSLSRTTGKTAAVPEPTTLATLVLGVLLLTPRRHP